MLLVVGQIASIEADGSDPVGRRQLTDERPLAGRKVDALDTGGHVPRPVHQEGPAVGSKAQDVVERIEPRHGLRRAPVRRITPVTAVRPARHDGAAGRCGRIAGL